jgi:hypothetical protein
MPKPEFSRDDFENPDAPEGERLLRSDHPFVRDLSYETSRMRQEWDLGKAALISTAIDPFEKYRPGDELPEGETFGPSLELYIKERSRGPGYVADFLYDAAGLPVTVYGILVNFGHGLEISELELWRKRWGYWDEYDCFIDDPEAQKQLELEQQARHGASASQRRVGITSDLLRRIPLGEIVERAQQDLADRPWEREGIRVLPGEHHSPNEIPEATAKILDTANARAVLPPRGRPRLDDQLLQKLAEAYVVEARNGRGLIQRLATRFNRPAPTIKDWVRAARERGFISHHDPETDTAPARTAGE